MLLGGAYCAVATTRPWLQQILVNLLDNAIKFTERGTVTLTVRVINRDQPGSSSTPSLLFDVSDTGMGLAEDELSRLFQPFHRVRSAAPGGAGGTGLGLAICQRLAGRLGGEISARSTPGVGSTFALTLPLSAPVPSDRGEVSGSASSGDTRSRAAAGPSRAGAPRAHSPGRGQRCEPAAHRPAFEPGRAPRLSRFAMARKHSSESTKRPSEACPSTP